MGRVTPGGIDRIASPARSASPVAATVLVAATMLLAVIAGLLAVLELRDALTFDVRATHAVWLNTHVMRLQVDEETGVRGYAVTHRPLLLQPYVAARGELPDELEQLAKVTRDLAIPTGPPLAAALQSVNSDWLAGVAKPLVQSRLTRAQSDTLEIRSKALVDRFRLTNGQLSAAERGAIGARRDSFNIEFLRIVALFLGSVLLCVAAIALAAGQLVRIDRARARAESLVREREILYEQGQAWSKSFQRAVLPPRLPNVAGCRFDAMYEPGESDARVGGDWYDAVQLSDGRIMVSVGDVAGGGLEAAVIMGVVRQIMRGIAQVHADPVLMLDAADRALRIEYADVFVTAWVGVIDPVTHELSYASAGHPPGLLLDDTGRVTDLSDATLPLGLRQGLQSSATSIVLDDGATLLLYTDGLTGATGDIVAGDALVRAAARRVAQTRWNSPAVEIAHGVLERRSQDDVAILVAGMRFADAERHIWRMQFDASDAGAARDARRAFVAQLERRGFSAVESMNAELVFGELTGNVLRHGGGNSAVDIAIDSRANQIVLHVLDRGPGFRHISRLPSDPFSESGRGLFLIAAMTDEFSVAERTDGGSHARAVLIGGVRAPAFSNAAKATVVGP